MNGDCVDLVDARQRRLLLDSPLISYCFRPFLEEMPPDGREFVLVPTTPDTAPLARWTERALQQ